MSTTLVLSLLVLIGIVAVKSQSLANATCDDDEYNCTKCYNLLVWNVLKSSKNRYQEPSFLQTQLIQCLSLWTLLTSNHLKLSAEVIAQFTSHDNS